jgi:hypothetical protein
MTLKDPSVEKDSILFVGGQKVGDSLPSILFENSKHQSTMNIRRIKQKHEQPVVPPQILPSRKEFSCNDDELAISAMQTHINYINKKPLKLIADTSR